MLSRLKLAIANADLRVKVAVAIAVPVMLAFFLLSIATFLAAERMAEQQAGLATVELGDVLLRSLRHTMLANDADMLQASLQDVASERSIAQVWLLDVQGKVKMSSDPADEGTVVQTSNLGCEGCHSFPPAKRPLALRVPSDGRAVRVAVPVPNETACHSCHPADQKHLGVLLIDASLNDIEQSLSADLRRNLLLSALFSALIGLGVYLLINRLIVRPVEKIHDVVVDYSQGNLTARVPADKTRTDEIAVLGKTFNEMADSLAEQEEQRATSARVRELAISEERERIARELHDGIAQFLAYVSTKTEAARIFLEKGQREKVEEYLHNLEEEARKQSLDVRASILGLKMFTSERHGLAEDVRTCVEQSNRFMDLEILTEIDPALEGLPLEAETELQLLRILQEAISNIRKHSHAKTASVLVQRDGASGLELRVQDDGIGFDPGQVGQKGQPHFGLSTMRERAEAIGADFELEFGSEQRHHHFRTVEAAREPTMRILVADDHSLFRDGLVSLLEAGGYDVIGQAGDGREAVDKTLSLSPDLVLLDINMPQLTGLQAVREIKSASPGTKVVMLTVSEEDADLLEAIHAGAEGYLLKHLNASEFLEMIQSVERGEAAISRSMAGRLFKRGPAGRHGGGCPLRAGGGGAQARGRWQVQPGYCRRAFRQREHGQIPSPEHSPAPQRIQPDRGCHGGPAETHNLAGDFHHVVPTRAGRDAFV